MILNGILIETEEQLEIEIQNLSETTKISLRCQFLGTPAPDASQFEKDYNKYLKRAQVKDQIIAEMATENIQRVRAGTWSTQQLIELTQDVELKLVLDDVSTLSFELAAQKIQSLTNPLITQQIKNNWQLKLSTHFYLNG